MPTETAQVVPGRYLALTLEDLSLRCVLAEVSANDKRDVTIYSDERVPLPEQVLAEKELRKIAGTVRQKLHGIIPSELHGIQSIGISSPGIIDANGKRLIDLSWLGWSPHGGRVASISRLNFASLFNARYKGRIVADNDTVMSALGERWHIQRYSGGKPVPDFAYIRVGNGMNGAIFINGRPWRGQLHPEMGHFVMPAHPEDKIKKFFCKVHGPCLEGRVSSLRLRILEEKLGKEKMQEIAAFYIAQLCHVITVIMAPPKIILAGHTIVNNPDIIEIVKEIIQQQLLKGYPRNAKSSERDYIAPAALSVEEASWQGALLAAIDPTHPQNANAMFQG